MVGWSARPATTPTVTATARPPRNTPYAPRNASGPDHGEAVGGGPDTGSTTWIGQFRDPHGGEAVVTGPVRFWLFRKPVQDSVNRQPEKVPIWGIVHPSVQPTANCHVAPAEPTLLVQLKLVVPHDWINWPNDGLEQTLVHQDRTRIVALASDGYPSSPFEEEPPGVPD
jgi:hypothetical protein